MRVSTAGDELNGAQQVQPAGAEQEEEEYEELLPGNV